MKRPVVKKLSLLLFLLLTARVSVTFAYPTQKADPLPLATTSTNATNTAGVDADAMRAYVEIQAQLHATQMTLERNQQEAEAASTRATQDLAERLAQIEKTVTDQHISDLKTMQSSNRVILIVAGTFAGLGFLAMLFTAYFQWRGVTKLTEITLTAVPAGGHAPNWGMQTIDGTSGTPIDSVARLLSVIDRLEKRVLELEGTSRTPLPDAAPAESSGKPVSEHAGRITLLLGKGQSLLNLDKNEEAVTCLDEVLGLDQNNTDALVKKGVALERLRRLNEAIDCYDKAIAADSSVTIAYLYKGGVFNRLERFDEALQCYEQALRAQEAGTTTT